MTNNTQSALSQPALSQSPHAKIPAQTEISAIVSVALKEDIGSGDITAELIPADATATAKIISKQDAIFCGIPWADEVFKQIDPTIEVNWQVQDGAAIRAHQVILEVSGNSRSLLTAERSVLNFLQTLSATATQSNEFTNLVKHTECTILDTRKTLPGLRLAQKYAVTCGGGSNHRIGLFDAFLIKENHIHACGSIAAAINTARMNHPDKKLEVEVESIQEMQEASKHHADVIMLDNFTLEELRLAVELNAGQVKLEASGMVDAESLVRIAETGVDFVSLGALTKHCQAVDLSMLFNA